ncbi:unnamed protein product, partial [Didymodactylos carnosus]
KLTRQIEQLRKKTTIVNNENANHERNEKKINRFIEEIRNIKKLKLKDVVLFAMENEGTFQSILKQHKESVNDIKQHSLIRLSTESSLQTDIMKLKTSDDFKESWQRLLIQYKSRRAKRRAWKEKANDFKQIESELKRQQDELENESELLESRSLPLKSKKKIIKTKIAKEEEEEVNNEEEVEEVNNEEEEEEEVNSEEEKKIESDLEEEKPKKKTEPFFRSKPISKQSVVCIIDLENNTMEPLAEATMDDEISSDDVEESMNKSLVENLNEIATDKTPLVDPFFLNGTHKITYQTIKTTSSYPSVGDKNSIEQSYFVDTLAKQNNSMKNNRRQQSLNIPSIQNNRRQQSLNKPSIQNNNGYSNEKVKRVPSTTIHPSWEASRSKLDQCRIQKSQAKKIVFNDSGEDSD